MEFVAVFVFGCVMLFVAAACSVTVLLKGRYVPAAAGVVLVVLGAVVVTVSETLGVVAVMAGGIVWIVAAVPLAKPASRWARQLYGPQKLARADARTDDVPWRPATPEERTPPVAPYPPGPVASPPTPAAAPPGILTAAVAAIGVGAAVLGFAGGEALGAGTTGVVAPLLWVLRAGWRTGRAGRRPPGAPRDSEINRT